MATHITSTGEAATGALLFASDRWFDPIEHAVRARVRGFIEGVFEAELTEALQQPRYKRVPVAPEGGAEPGVGQRHGHRKRTLLGSFGTVEIKVPRARLEGADGATREWKSKAFQSCQRRTRKVDALIAGA
jgi:transposase-like protein